MLAYLNIMFRVLSCRRLNVDKTNTDVDFLNPDGNGRVHSNYKREAIKVEKSWVNIFPCK